MGGGEERVQAEGCCPRSELERALPSSRRASRGLQRTTKFGWLNKAKVTFFMLSSTAGFTSPTVRSVSTVPTILRGEGRERVRRGRGGRERMMREVWGGGRGGGGEGGRGGERLGGDGGRGKGGE